MTKPSKGGYGKKCELSSANVIWHLKILRVAKAQNINSDPRIGSSSDELKSLLEVGFRFVRIELHSSPWIGIS